MTAQQGFGSQRGRRSVLRTATGVAVLAAVVGVAQLADGPERTEPLALGVTTPGGPTADAELDAVATAVGEEPSLVLFYADFTSAPPIADLDAVAARGATPVVTWEPWDWQAPESGVYSLDRIAAGEHDGYLTAWADALRAWGRPVLLRFAHEQNGDWYPWAVGVGSTSAEDHIAAFRHLNEVFDARGAGNVRFVWNPNVHYAGASSLSVTWPGARYVDQVALDGYNWGTSTPSSTWQDPEEVFAASLDELRNLAPGVPVLIAEVGCAEQGGDKAAWVSDLVSWLDDQPDVSAFVWFEHDKETDWRITSSPDSAVAMRQSLAGRRLVAR